MFAFDKLEINGTYALKGHIGTYIISTRYFNYYTQFFYATDVLLLYIEKKKIIELFLLIFSVGWWDLDR